MCWTDSKHTKHDLMQMKKKKIAFKVYADLTSKIWVVKISLHCEHGSIITAHEKYWKIKTSGKKNCKTLKKLHES
jgi:hypothetical protein